MKELHQSKAIDCFLSSERLLRSDTNTVLTLWSTVDDAFFKMSILPYYALFYKSYSEYFNLPMASESQLKITTIRNYIKNLSDGFEKSTKVIELTDKAQNNVFRKQANRSFIKSLGLYDNLGIYFNEDKKIIGNTYQIAECRGINSVFDRSECNKKSLEIHNEINSLFRSISIISGLERCPLGGMNTYYGHDINTNSKQGLFNNSNAIKLNLFFVYLLANMNFVKFILGGLLPNDNTWLFRMKYIVNYYTMRAIERYNNWCKSNKYNNALGIEAEEIILMGNLLFDSSFRNCMMHYRIERELKSEFYNPNIPFYGLVESCFDGILFRDYVKKQDDIANKIISCLEKQFDVDSVTLKKKDLLFQK